MRLSCQNTDKIRVNMFLSVIECCAARLSPDVFLVGSTPMSDSLLNKNRANFSTKQVCCPSARRELSKDITVAQKGSIKFGKTLREVTREEMQRR